jgi:hypothetical protein
MKMGNLRNSWTHAWIILCALIPLAGCTGSRLLTKPYSPETMLHFSQLKGWDETKSLNNHVIFVNEGDTIPLKLAMETDFMTFKQDQIDIVAKQKLYFMIKMPETINAAQKDKLNSLDAESSTSMSNERKASHLRDYMLYISKDAVHWGPLYGGNAYREVLGFKSGLISFMVMADTVDGLKSSLAIKTVNR